MLSRITLRLARNPGTEFPNGDDRHGYVLIAPLDGKNYIDVAEWKQHPDLCTILHFKPDFPAPLHGLLRRRGDSWYFDYDDESSDDDEPVFKLGRHPFLVGEYVTVTDENNRPLTYRIEEVTTPA